MKKFSYLREEAEEIINKTFDKGVDLPDADKVPVDSEREETDDVPADDEDVALGKDSVEVDDANDVVERLTKLAARKEKQGKLEEAEQIRNTIKMYSEALNLSNKGWMGLGIYLAYKPAYRREYMDEWKLDYNEVVSELTQVGLIRNNKLNLPEAMSAFKSKFPDIRPAATREYAKQLNITK